MRKHRRFQANIATFLVIFLATGTNAFSQADVKLLLRAIATACRDKYTGGYVVDIQRWELTNALSNSGPAAGYRSGIPLPTGHMEKDGYRGRIVMARLANMFRFELHSAFDEEWQWTSDGRTTWCYRLDRNIYTEAAADPKPEWLGPGPGLQGTEWKFLTHFLAIADVWPHAKVIRDDIPPTRRAMVLRFYSG